MFNLGDFLLHSGKTSKIKIECDDLTEEDYKALAYIGSRHLFFGRVIGVPTGGLKFAEALEEYITTGHPKTLIADDVLTTGASIEVYAEQNGLRLGANCNGLVIFQRSPFSRNYVHSIFTLNHNMGRCL